MCTPIKFCAASSYTVKESEPVSWRVENAKVTTSAYPIPSSVDYMVSKYQYLLPFNGL